MVANISSHKRGWDERWEEFSEWAERGKKYHEELLALVDEDTAAFNRVIAAFGLPQGTEPEQAKRDRAIEDATKAAIDVPFRVMEVAYESMEVIKAMAEIGNPNSASDAAVGALCARTAVMGAYLNVRINTPDLKDREFAEDRIARGKEICDKAVEQEKEVLAIVESKL
jgi:glutamate formiminotransferase/formiminotetrahydrofolate cyclodeaminase